MGRATQGVRLINIQDTDSIAAVTKVDHEDEIDAIVEGAEPEGVSPDAVTPTDEATAPTEEKPE